MRRRGLPRGRSSARAAFIRKRAPNSDVDPTSSITSCAASAALDAQQCADRCRRSEVRKPQHDAVVGGLHLHIGFAESVACALRQRHSPRSVDAAAERRVKHHAHCAGLVAEVLEDDVSVVRHDSRRRALRVHVLDERVHRRARRSCIRSSAPFASDVSASCRRRAADAVTELERPRHVLAVPEGHPRRRARRWMHDHAIVLDGGDAPGGRPELKRVADARLVHELLIELTQSRSIGEVHGVETAIGDRSAGDHGHHSRSAVASERPVTRSQVIRALELGGDVGRILAGEHCEHFFECTDGETVVRIRAANHAEQIAS